MIDFKKTTALSANVESAYEKLCKAGNSVHTAMVSLTTAQLGYTLAVRKLSTYITVAASLDAPERPK